MKECNKTITVFNKRQDPTTGYDAYYPTVITGVSFYSEISSNVSDEGLRAANIFTIRIPVDADFSGKSYVSPVDYKASLTPASVFTLDNGDTIVEAAVTTSKTPAELQELYGEVVTILGVTDNRDRRCAPHWKVVGK